MGAAAAGGMSLAATGFTMLGQYTSSRAEAGAEKFKAEQLEQQAQYGDLKAQQTNAQMTQRLAVTLGHIDAVRAAAHTDATSPTGGTKSGGRLFTNKAPSRYCPASSRSAMEITVPPPG